MQRKSLTTSHRQINAHTNSHLGNQIPTLLPLPQFLLLSMTLYGIEYPFGQVRSAVLAMSPPNLLPTSSILS